MSDKGLYDEKFKDMDATITAITTEYTWEYHPFLELMRQQSIAHAIEMAVLYLPTAPEAHGQMWLFPNAQILPIEDIDTRVAQGGGQVHIHPKSVGGIANLVEDGWRVTERSLRKEN